MLKPDSGKWEKSSAHGWKLFLVNYRNCTIWGREGTVAFTLKNREIKIITRIEISVPV